jgi:Domain of unknown function (DUF4349)
MNSDIRFLQGLEDDLREAADRERRTTADPPARSSEPRRPPRRGWNWGGIAAAIVAFLVLAGGIGFLAQGGVKSASPGTAAMPSMSAQAHGVPAPVARAPGLPAVAPSPAQRDEAAGFGGNGQVISGDSTGGQKSASTVNGAGVLPPAPQTDLSKIERDGQIGVLLPNGQFSRNVADVTRIAVTNGGMVLSSSTQNNKSGTFTLRIPASHFDRAMLQLRALGTAPAQILYQDIAGQDVTAQFVDLKARLAIVRGTKARLVSLQHHATTTGEILSLGNQIDQVQLQIEQLQGQINFINNQVAEATIRVELREKDVPVQETTVNHVKQPSLGSAWSRSLQGFLRVIGAVIVGLGYLIPIAVVAFGFWFAVTLVQRKRREASSAP